MKFHGPILDNLNNALASARLLRSHPVYKDALAYWNELIQEARRIQRDPAYEQADLPESVLSAGPDRSTSGHPPLGNSPCPPRYRLRN